MWTGLLVNRIGAVVQPFLSLYLAGARSLSPATIGVLVAISGLGSLVSQIVGGWLADSFGRRRTMLLGLFSSAGALLWLGYSTTPAWLAVSAFTAGLAIDLYRPAIAAATADLVEPGNRVLAYGMLFWAVNLGFSVATVSAGLVARGGFTTLFWIDAATAVACAALIWLSVPETLPAPDGESPIGYRTLMRDYLALALVAMSTVHASVWFQGITTLPLTMVRAGLSSAVYGWTIALNGIVIVALQPLLVRRLARFDHSTVLAIGMAVHGCGFGLAALANEPVGFGLSVVVWTLGEIGYAAVINVVFAGLAPVALRGRYLGAAGFAWGLGGITGPLAGTATLHQLGATTLWVGCAVVGLILCGCQLALTTAIRARMHPAEELDA
jgi:MFS family permease